MIFLLRDGLISKESLAELISSPGKLPPLDGTNRELLAGDITGSDNQPPDNRVDGADFSLFISDFNPFAPAPAGTKADFDLNDYVDGGDFALLVGNFNPFASGDE